MIYDVNLSSILLPNLLYFVKYPSLETEGSNS